MVVIIDSGAVVKKFGSPESAWSYAEAMMKKRHIVWVVRTATARGLEFI